MTGFFIWENILKCCSITLAEVHLLCIQIVQLCELKQAHFIIMEQCHSGLKVLVMNNYGTRREHGRIQNKEEWRGQLSRKQVCAMNYTCREMAAHFRWMHFWLSCARLCLHSALLGKWRQGKYKNGWNEKRHSLSVWVKFISCTLQLQSLIDNIKLAVGMNVAVCQWF